MKKIFRHIHLWLSVPFGAIITLICFSGAMLVFETEIMQLRRHDLYYVEEVKAAPLPAHRLMEMAAATLPEGTEATGLTVQADPQRSWQVSLSQPRRASLFIDPYTGAKCCGAIRTGAVFLGHVQAAPLAARQRPPRREDPSWVNSSSA